MSNLNLDNFHIGEPVGGFSFNVDALPQSSSGTVILDDPFALVVDVSKQPKLDESRPYVLYTDGSFKYLDEPNIDGPPGPYQALPSKHDPTQPYKTPEWSMASQSKQAEAQWESYEQQGIPAEQRPLRFSSKWASQSQVQMAQDVAKREIERHTQEYGSNSKRPLRYRRK